VERPQAWRPQTTRLAQDPHRYRRANAGNQSSRDHGQQHRGFTDVASSAQPDPARTGDWQRDGGWRIRHAPMPQRYWRSWSGCGNTATQKCSAMESNHRRCHREECCSARVKISGSGALAELRRLPPPEPRRNQDALHETTRPTPDGPGLRPPGRRGSGAHRDPELLHRPWHPRRKGSGVNPSGVRGKPFAS
jgi:hypothetical protein